MDKQAAAIQFGRPVIDKTGLTSKYDFVLKYKNRWDSDRAPDDPDPRPPLDRALREQLGLKVEPAKGPVKILVIDHVEKPSENEQRPKPPSSCTTNLHLPGRHAVRPPVRHDERHKDPRETP